MGNRAERIARKEKFMAKLDARDRDIDDWWEQLPRRKIMVMGQELEITEWEFERLEYWADYCEFSDVEAYLTGVLEEKWDYQASFTLAEVLLTEIAVLANDGSL